MSDDGSLLLIQGLTDQERVLFLAELNGKQKDVTVGVLLALFLGGLGGHRFYMGQTGLGVLYLCFFWTFVPAFVAVIECFFMSSRVSAYNHAVGTQIVLKLKALRADADALKALESSKE